VSHADCKILTGEIGKHVVIGRGGALLQSVQIGTGVKIGDYTYVNYGTLISSGIIGKFSSIGPYGVIGATEHPLKFLSTSPRTYGSESVFGLPSCWDDIQEQTVIGNDVWLGALAFIKQGVHVGDGAVVAAVIKYLDYLEPVINFIPLESKQYPSASLSQTMEAWGTRGKSAIPAM
jgi:acetyltransferase-like isoleucine patch superfamily enzyme